jgi:hypothetical protein
MRKLAPLFDAATNVEIRKRLQQHIEAGTCDTAAGEIEVDPAEYFDPGWAARERDAVFGRTPIVVAHTSELPAPHRVRSRHIRPARPAGGRVGTGLRQPVPPPGRAGGQRPVR